MPMVVVELHCTCGTYERTVTSEFAPPMRGVPHLGAITKARITTSASTSTTDSPVSPTERRGEHEPCTAVGRQVV